MGELQAQHLPHYTRVMASMLTEGLAHGLRWAYETLGRSDKRVLVIHVSVPLGLGSPLVWMLT